MSTQMLNYTRFALYTLSAMDIFLLGVCAAILNRIGTDSIRTNNYACYTGNDTPQKKQLISSALQNPDVKWNEWLKTYDTRINNFDLDRFIKSEQHMRHILIFFRNKLYSDPFVGVCGTKHFLSLSQDQQEEVKGKITNIIDQIHKAIISGNNNISTHIESLHSITDSIQFDNQKLTYETFKKFHHSGRCDAISFAINADIYNRYDANRRSTIVNHFCISGGILLAGLASAFMPNLSDAAKIAIQSLCLTTSGFIIANCAKVCSDLNQALIHNPTANAQSI